MRQRFSKSVFAILITAVLMLGIVVPTMAASGGGVPPTGTATAAQANIFVSYQNGGFVIPKQMAAVSADLSDIYGYTDNITSVSALDVLIKAHEIYFNANNIGENFTDWLHSSFNTDNEYSMLSIFGEGTSFSVAVNGAMPVDESVTFPESEWGPASYLSLAIPDIAVTSGDYVEILYYNDFMWGDYYTWFSNSSGSKIENITVSSGQPLNLKLNGYSFMYYGAVTSDALRDGTEINNHGLCEDLPAVKLNPTTGAVISTLADIDEDGNFSVTFTEAGKYIISAEGDEFVDIFAPWLEVIVDWQGEGTEQSPYLISNQSDLDWLSASVSGGKNFAGKYFKVTNDITLSANWTPIGTPTKLFSGVFDGNFKTISFAYGSNPLFGNVAGGATVKNLNIYGEYIANFGLISGFNATSSNINIDNITIKSGTTIKKSGLAGDPAASVTLYNITNCTVEKDVKIGYDKVNNAPADSSDGYPAGAYRGGPGVGSFVSGLCGSISNCVSYATVYGQSNVGGIAGYKAQSTRSFTIRNCSFEGEIIATGNHVGGIVGNGYTHSTAPSAYGVTIENCYVTGNITGADRVGGIFGGEGGQSQAWAAGAGYIRSNHFVGKVSAASGNAVGGIIGFMKSLDRYNVIANNYYLNTCGAQRGIGAVQIIDTNHSNPTAINGTQYTYTQNYHREDDPMGVDANILAKSATAREMQISTLALLNNGAGSLGNWIMIDKYPIIRRAVTVYFTLYGDTAHGAGGDVHTMRGNNLTQWLAKKSYSAFNDNTVEDIIETALTEAGMSMENDGNYISSITNGTTEIGAVTNGAASGWVYSLNGRYPKTGIDEQYIKNNDEIILHYSDDYTSEDMEIEIKDVVSTPDRVTSVYVSLGELESVSLMAVSYSDGRLVELKPLNKITKSGEVQLDLSIPSGGQVKLALWELDELRPLGDAITK